jgi:16S rRNA (guanine527-N7)-methyltransferase
LTAARDEAAVAEHVRDSLALVPYVRAPYVDVGSGGGFPAIPLAIATGARSVLIESLGKKARFLREAIVDLGLDASVLAERAEAAGRDPDHRGAYASATARAVGGATTVLELTIPLLAIGGLAILQRGAADRGETKALDDACLVLGAALEAEVAQAGNRRLLLVRKIAETGQRFPRKSGQASKKPLCT